MTLKRLMIVLAVLVFLAGVGIMWLWQYAYTPEGRARIIIAQLKNDTTSLRGWMLQHHLVRPGFSVPPQDASSRARLKSELARYRRIANTIGLYTPPNEGGMSAAVEMVKLGREALPIVIEALRDNNRDVRMMAIWVCGDFHDPASAQPLAQCMAGAAHDARNTPQIDFDVQCWSMESLVEIGPAAYGPLVESSRKCHPIVRVKMVSAIAKRLGAAAMPQLLELIEDPDGSVRARAAYELGQLKDRRAADALIRHLSDADSSAGLFAADALGEIDDPRVVPSLLKTMKDEHISNTVRLSAAQVLAQKGRDEELPFLLTMLTSPEPADRESVAVTLRFPAIHGSFDPLLSLLDDNDSSVRSKALESLRNLQDPRAIPALKELLDDPDSQIRADAANALENPDVKLPPAPQLDNPYSRLEPAVPPSTSTQAASNPTTAPSADELLLFTAYGMRPLIESVGKKRYVAIVEFQSGFDTANEPLTKIEGDDKPNSSHQNYLVIDGQMKLIQSFAAPPPALGRIQGRFPISLSHFASPGPDSVEVRMAGLLGDLYSADIWTKETRPKKAVAVGNSKTKNVLDGHFFGPLPEDQVENCKQLLACLVKMPFFRIPEADARRLLKNPNPFLVWLGILRLIDSQDNKSRIRVADYFTAMRALPVALLPELGEEMSLQLGGTTEPEILASVSKETLAFLREADSARQLALLGFLNQGLGSLQTKPTSATG